MRHLTIIATVIALVACVGINAEACDTTPAQNTQASHVYVVGQSTPSFRTPVRDTLWWLLRPRHYQQPVYRVQAVQPCPNCGRFH